MFCLRPAKMKFVNYNSIFNKEHLDFSHIPMYMRFNETTLLLIFSISSSETTALYRFGRKIWTVVDSQSRIVSKTDGPNLLVIRLARTIGYILSVSKELILSDWHVVISSNFLRVPSARNDNSYYILCFNVKSTNLFLPKSK